jgi:predicted cupin superfamily sugar epimerase
MGTTVAPAFDFSDFELGRRELLFKQFGDQQQLIEKLSAG